MVVAPAAVAEATATRLTITEVFREIIEDMMIDRHTQTAGKATIGTEGMKKHFYLRILSFMPVTPWSSHVHRERTLPYDWQSKRSCTSGSKT